MRGPWGLGLGGGCVHGGTGGVCDQRGGQNTDRKHVRAQNGRRTQNTEHRTGGQNTEPAARTQNRRPEREKKVANKTDIK